jgi:hypothetical protein
MKPFRTFFANSLDALIPEFWAQESLAILEENTVAAMLVHRDFENYVANFGDTVNTRQPGEFQGKRKTANDNVTIQDANSTNVPVKLDQHVHTSFLLRDGEESYSFKDLVAEYLAPAMIAQSRFVDQVILGQYPAFFANGYGKLGGLSGSTAKDYLLGARNMMNKNKAHVTGRNMVWTPDGETAALNTDMFLSAEKVGDDGTALREASLGRKMGFQNYMCQNMSDFSDGDVAATGAINNAAGYAKGTTALTVDGFSAAIGANSWIKIAGDDTPLRVVSTTGGATPTAITVAAPGLRNAVLDDAVVTHYGSGTVDGNFAAGYAKYIAVDDFTIAPQVGQYVTIHTSPTSPIYTIVDYDATDGILLDRPLEAAIADDQVINLGPGGSFNFAFHRNALALVSRPLAQPRAGAGALSSVVNYNGLSMRAVITYDGEKQGHLVTLDMLLGVKVLKPELGAVIFG